MKSLRRRVLLLTLFASLLVWLATWIGTVFTIRKELNALLDAHLIQSANVLYSLIQDELKENYAIAVAEDREFDIRIAHLRSHLERHKYHSEIAFQVAVGNRVHFSSAASPNEPLNKAGRVGFPDIVIAGDPWRVYAFRDAEGLVSVATGQALSGRSSLLNALVAETSLPILVGLPVLAFAVWYLAKASVRPLDRIADAIRSKMPATLTPMEHDDVDEEIRPMVAALNQLLHRLDETLQKERSFTADAAHELRTPISGLRLQAELALKSDDPTTVRSALNQIIKVVDATTRMTEQLLTLARLDQDNDYHGDSLVDLTEVVGEVVEMTLDDDARRRLRVQVIGTPLVRGNRETMIILVRNLLDNAFVHGGDKTGVELRCEAEPGQIALSVVDHGPGIAADERERVLSRFHRGSRSRRTAGSGLGLAIVQRVVEIHGAELKLSETAGGGLTVTVTFTAAKPAPLKSG